METLWLYGEDGTRHRAFVRQERIDTSSMDGTGSIPGLKTVTLEDGTPLNNVDEKTFKNPITGELLSLFPKAQRSK
jgi:hypothetical protein